MAQNRLARGLTWEELKDAIKDELVLGDEAESQSRMDEMFTLTRRGKEGVTSFLLRFQTLLQSLLHPMADAREAGDGTVDGKAVFIVRSLRGAMLRGLKHKELEAQVRRGMSCGKASTWDSFVALVRSEAAILQVSDVGPAVVTDRGGGGGSGGGDRAGAATGGSARPRRATAEESDRSRRRRLNLCLHCGAKGHYEASCPSKPSNPRRAGNGGEATAAV